MIFSLVIALMIILIAAFWTYQGFFSSFIMFMDALIAAVLAFAFYESLHGVWQDSIGDGLGHALALMGIFLVSLFVLRTITDRIVPDDIQMPVIVARIGGGVFGFLSAMLLTGTALIAIQMMPIGAGVFSFERLSQDPETGKVSESRLGIFSPDTFTYGIISGLSSDGRFGGGNSLAVAKPDFVMQLYSARAVPQSEARMFVPETCLKVRDWWVVPSIDTAKHEVGTGDEAGSLKRTFETREPTKLGSHYVVATVYVDKSAAPEKNPDIRFRLAQFRIVGYDRDGASSPSVYLASGMTDIYSHRHLGPYPVDDRQRERLVAFGPMTNFILSDNVTKVVAKDKGYEFQVAFEVPNTFKPWYVAFKYGGMAKLPAKPVEEIPAYASKPQGENGLSGYVRKAVVASAGSTSTAWDVPSVVRSETGFTAKIPMPLPPDDNSINIHMLGENLAGPTKDCHFYWNIPDFEPNLLQIDEFWVPNGYDMLQVTFKDKKMQSMYGRAIKFAQRVTAQTYVTDSSGKQHFAIGQYAVAKVNGRWVLEIQYYPNQIDQVPERALQGKKALKITPKILEDDPDNSWFGFLFLIPKDVKEIKEFQSGTGKGEDLNISR